MLNFLAFAALFGSSAVAWRWGGLDERLASIGFITATGASQIFTNRNYGNVETAVLLIDACLLAGLVILALRSDRFWPMWAAAFQLVGTTVHFASMTETGDFAWAYAVGLIFWSYPVLFALMIGTWLEARNRQHWIQPAE
jgi:hypothetical protein